MATLLQSLLKLRLVTPLKYSIKETNEISTIAAKFFKKYEINRRCGKWWVKERKYIESTSKDIYTKTIDMAVMQRQNCLRDKTLLGSMSDAHQTQCFADVFIWILPEIVATNTHLSWRMRSCSLPSSATSALGVFRRWLIITKYTTNARTVAATTLPRHVTTINVTSPISVLLELESVTKQNCSVTV